MKDLKYQIKIGSQSTIKVINRITNIMTSKTKAESYLIIEKQWLSL
jgi:hypothetical protein